MQKKWLEQREARKKELMQAKAASNLTDEQWWDEYYRYYRYDLNKSMLTRTKSQRKPGRLNNTHSKSKRKKPQKQNHSKHSPHLNGFFDVSTLMTTSTTATDSPQTTTFPTTTFVTVESTTTATTADIIKSIDYQQPNIHDDKITSEINSSTQINDRMSLNKSSTSTVYEISTILTSSTTEHSIMYNVTFDQLNHSQTNLKSNPRKLTNAVWGRWQKWTKCSRSCGGGVMSQSRQCLSR